MKRLISYIEFFRKFGAINSFHRIINHYRVWEFPNNPKVTTFKTSITDDTEHAGYSALCSKATHDDQTFSKFRSCISMVDVLDHVTIEQGKLYLKVILEQYPSLVDQNTLKAIKRIDSFGSPLKWYFPKVGTMSPTLLRYLKVYGDLERLFGPISNFHIAEIGIGFGGQTAVTATFGAKSFALFDLPEVLSLAKKFISQVNVLATIDSRDGRDPISHTPDLVVSNYAFSELSRELQQRYLTSVILNSSRGYITWNNSAEDKLGGYSLAELLRVIPNSQILPEIPLTSTFNSIIVWGHRHEKNIND